MEYSKLSDKVLDPAPLRPSLHHARLPQVSIRHDGRGSQLHAELDPEPIPHLPTLRQKLGAPPRRHLRRLDQDGHRRQRRQRLR